MKYINVAALTVGLASAAPAKQPSAFEGLVSKTAEEVSDFQVQVLGGMTLRAPQVYNTNFIQMKRGPRAYVQSLRKYSAFGATIPPNLLQIIDEILGELGLGDLLGDGTGTGTGAGTGAGAGNGGSGSGGQQGGNGTQHGGGSGRGGGSNGGGGRGGSGGGGNGTAPSNGTASGPGQGAFLIAPMSCGSLTAMQERLPLFLRCLTASTWRQCRSELHRRMSHSTLIPDPQISGSLAVTRRRRRFLGRKYIPLARARLRKPSMAPAGQLPMEMAAVRLG